MMVGSELRKRKVGAHAGRARSHPPERKGAPQKFKKCLGVSWPLGPASAAGAEHHPKNAQLRPRRRNPPFCFILRAASATSASAASSAACFAAAAAAGGGETGGPAAARRWAGDPAGVDSGPA